MLGDREYMKSGAPFGTYAKGGSEKSVVIKIIIINVIIFILQILTRDTPTSYCPATGPHRWGGVTSWLWLSVPTFSEVWRLGTYMFVHGSTFMHILFNMWTLYIFGRPVEQRLGSSAFLKLYLISGVIGAVSWIIFNQDSTAPLVGASGAIFGVMAAAAMLFPSMQIMLLFPPVVLKVKTLVICLAIINIVMLYNVHSNIAYLAHLGGLLGGFLFTRKHLSKDRLSQSRRTSKSQGFGSLVQNMKSTINKKINNDRVPDLRIVEKSKHADDEDIITSEIDPILDKIGTYGMQSLTANERRVLERAREKLKDRS